MQLKNLRLSVQINLITALGMIGFVITVMMIALTFIRMTEYQDRQTKASVALGEADELKYLFLNARRDEKDFFIRMNMSYVGKHAQTLEKARSIAARLKSFHSDNAEDAKVVDTLNTHLTSYEKQFALVVSQWQTIGLTEKEGLQGRLRNSVHEVETALKKHKSDQLSVTMLMMRRHEKDFIMRLDSKYLGRMDKRLSEFIQQIDASNIPENEQKKIMELMNSYHNDFKAYAKMRLEIVEQTEQLSKIFTLAQPPLDNLFQQTVKDSREASAAFHKTTKFAEILLISVAALFSIIMLWAGIYISKGITFPINQVAQIMERMTMGERGLDIPNTQLSNEIGKMCQSVAHFEEKLVEGEALQKQQAEDQKAQVERAKQAATITETFNSTVIDILARFEASIQRLTQAAGIVTDSSHNVSAEANTVASASSEASTNVQTVATATEELTASIREISSQVSQSTKVSGEAVTEAEATNDVVESLAEQATRIGEILKLISDIAEQTNLLALNATIEAARAGDAGKGFAVVANEVKNLASQTAKATSDIEEQIARVQNASQSAATAIRGVTKTIANIDEISSAIAAAVEEQQSATAEIARNVDEAATGTDMVANSIQNVSNAADASSDAAKSLSSVADELRSESKQLSDTVRDFISRIKNT